MLVKRVFTEIQFITYGSYWRCSLNLFTLPNTATIRSILWVGCHITNYSLWCDFSTTTTTTNNNNGGGGVRCKLQGNLGMLRNRKFRKIMKTIFSWGKFHYVQNAFKVANRNSTGCVSSTAPNTLPTRTGLAFYDDRLATRHLSEGMAILFCQQSVHTNSQLFQNISPHFCIEISYRIFTWYLL